MVLGYDPTKNKDYKKAFCNELIELKYNEIEEILFAKDETIYYPLVITYYELHNGNSLLGNLLLHFPETMLQLFNEALIDVQNDIIERHPMSEEMTRKYNCRVRIARLPSALCYRTLPRSFETGMLLSISGTVVRTGPRKVSEQEQVYQCTKCKGQFTMRADREQYYCIPEPKTCKAIGIMPCDSTKFKKISSEQASSETCNDFQEIKIQEDINALAFGRISFKFY